MTSTSRTARRGGLFRKVGWLSAAAMLAVATLAPAAHAASVTPTPINTGNPTCASFDASWTQFKLEGSSLADGVYTDGTLQVTISNYSNSSSGTPGSFDWTSNIGVDAVFVKAGSTKHNLFVYSPESTGDTELGPQSGTGNGISHISFCYDTELASASPSDTPSESPRDSPSESPSDTPSESPSDTPSESPSDTPSESPSDTPSESPSDSPSDAPSDTPSDAPTEQPTGSELPITTDAPASEAPTGEVGGVIGTPGFTPPPTDTMSPAQAPSTDGARAILIGLAAILIGSLAFSQPRRSSRRR